MLLVPAAAPGFSLVTRLGSSDRRLRSHRRGRGFESITSTRANTKSRREGPFRGPLGLSAAPVHDHRSSGA